MPRILILGLLAAGTWLIAYATTHYGLLAGLGIAAIPATMCFMWFSMRNVAVSMFLLFIVNYYLMALTRYLHDVPFGVILDVLLFYNILMLTFQAFVRNLDWHNARSGLTVVALIWTGYCCLEFVNPEVVSPSGWFMAVRSLAFYFLFTVVLTQLTLGRFKYLRYMIGIWAVLTLTAVIKACIQKYFGFSAAENYWLFVLGGHTTHIIRTGVRYFSFFSDAANFGGGMGLSMVVFSIASLYYHNRWMKVFLWFVAAAACYGMLISGTRSALAVPFVGFSVFLLLSKNFKLTAVGFVAVLFAFLFLNFTTIGQGNATIRRARSAFNTEDASFQVRMKNQEMLREIMADKPFGAGLGHGGGKAKAFAPTAKLSQIPTDSWFVMVWVETGVVGIVLHASILFYILAWGSRQVIFKLRHPQVRGLTAALICGVSGIVIMSIVNEVLGQIPTGIILYMSMAFIFLSPRFDQEMLAEQAAKDEAARLAANVPQPPANFE